ncbi:hypothetical protein SCYAM73S_00972 [Streptomyces cyaneofuscatus]
MTPSHPAPAPLPLREDSARETVRQASSPEETEEKIDAVAAVAAAR